MTGDELRRALGVLGLSTTEGARLLKVNFTTLYRQMKRGSEPIFGPYGTTIECWLKHGLPSKDSGGCR